MQFFFVTKPKAQSSSTLCLRFSPNFTESILSNNGHARLLDATRARCKDVLIVDIYPSII